MPEMMEIYRTAAEQYDELIGAEDYPGNLSRLLHDLVDWNDKRVYEAGIGTGRVTRMAIAEAARWSGYDREAHMLDRCRKNLAGYERKLSLAIADNIDLPVPRVPVDLFIEGWSFGHTVIENSDVLPECTDGLVERIRRIVRPGGTILIIESMGTNVSLPAVPGQALREFFSRLETRHGFSRNVIRTDYRFDSAEEAARITGFFFGPQMGDAVHSQGSQIVREYTGVWSLELPAERRGTE